MIDVLVRADASYAIGTGHVMRTLTLAQRLRAQGARVAFAMRPFPGDLIDTVEESGFPVLRLGAAAVDETAGWLGVPLATEIAQVRQALTSVERAPDWIVLDHYELAAEWEAAVSESGTRVFAIDDLANRAHACSALLDQNLPERERYGDLVPSDARLFLGPRYALVRDAFVEARGRARPRAAVHRILVFFGGVDARGATVAAVKALRNVSADFAVHVVVPSRHPHRDSVVAAVRGDGRFRLHGYVEEMAELMLGCDLAIGAGGTASWERCFVALPAVACAIAENQVPVVRGLAAAGAAVAIEDWETGGQESIATAVRELVNDPIALRAMSERTYALCDGHEQAAEELWEMFRERL